MCVTLAVGLAVASVAMAAGGLAMSYESGQSAAAATRQAQEEAMQAQNEGFNSRLEAQRTQLAEQTSVDDQANQRFSANQAAEQNALTTDLTTRQNQINATNAQTQAISGQADQAVSQGTQAVTPQTMAAAQTSQAASQTAMNAPGVANIQASNPLGAANTGVTKDAMDAGNAEAAKRVSQYGNSLANLSSYSAPLTLANQTATGINTNLMPVAAANQLVQTSAPALLAPSTLAYQQAKSYAGDVNQANTMSLQGATNLVNAKAAGATTLADLLQGDTTQNIQNQLALQQQADAAMAGMGSGITALGNAGVSFAGSQGAFKASNPDVPMPLTIQ